MTFYVLYKNILIATFLSLLLLFFCFRYAHLLTSIKNYKIVHLSTLKNKLRAEN
jgi:hypothetical protein